jgi:hypothetical protein
MTHWRQNAVAQRRWLPGEEYREGLGDRAVTVQDRLFVVERVSLSPHQRFRLPDPMVLVESALQYLKAHEDEISERGLNSEFYMGVSHIMTWPRSWDGKEATVWFMDYVLERPEFEPDKYHRVWFRQIL